MALAEMVLKCASRCRMLRLGSLVAAATLLLGADASGLICTRVSAKQLAKSLTSENPPLSAGMSPADDQDKNAQTNPANSKTEAKSQQSKDQPLQPETRLTLVRFVDGELARALEPLPAGKNGFHMKAGVPLDEKQLRIAVGSSGAAVNTGDRAQITGLQFKDKEIVVDINGGGRGKYRFRDHVHMEMGGGMPTSSTTTTHPDAPAVAAVVGATIFLDFDKQVPDLTPEELKRYLSGLLDFSRQRSAAVQWMDTLPADIQNAIKDNRPAVGMDREMVIAAVGRPDRKVREKGPDGNETEDWIYGKPPAKTVFVKFEGDKVTQVEQFP